jgi:hypothetical protein
MFIFEISDLEKNEEIGKYARALTCKVMGNNCGNRLKFYQKVSKSRQNFLSLGM